MCDGEQKLSFRHGVSSLEGCRCFYIGTLCQGETEQEGTHEYSSKTKGSYSGYGPAVP